MFFHYVLLLQEDGDWRVNLPIYDGPPLKNRPRKRIFKMKGSVISGMRGGAAMWNGDVTRLPWCHKVIEVDSRRGEADAKILWERSK